MMSWLNLLATTLITTSRRHHGEETSSPAMPLTGPDVHIPGVAQQAALATALSVRSREAACGSRFVVMV